LKALQRITAYAAFNNDARLIAPQISLQHFSARFFKEILGEIDAFCAAGICAVVLGKPYDEAHKPLTLEAFIERYRKSGPDFARALTGAYAYVLFDEKTDTVLAGVDRMARVPLAFTALGNGGVAIATSAHDLRDVPGVTLTLNPQSLYDYVFFHMIPAPTTLYEGVQRLAPGEQLIAKRGKVEVRAVWQPKFVEDRPATFEEAKKGFRNAIEMGVRDAVASSSNPGTFLSGGTDSSTVTGLVAQVTGKPAKAFSIGFDEEGYDETSYAKIAAKKFPVDHTIYYVTPQDVVDALPRVVEAYDQPFGNASAIPTYYCALRAREQGITAMIAGDGGDELFGGNDRYAEQAKLARWSALPNALRAPVRGAASVFAGLGGPFAKVDRGLKILELPTPARMQHYNLVSRLGAGNMFEADFLQNIAQTAPQDLLNEIYNGAQANTQLNKMLALDWRVTLSDSDLPKVTSMCAQAGMPVLYPMLNDRVTDFSLSLPTDFKLKGDQLRWFFKEALRDFLPEEIITKQKHGFGLPFGMWLGKHEGMKAQAMSALEDLKKRHIIRADFIDDIRSKLAGADASYYGVMVWVLVMLELWMQAHHDQAK
jgi:asparagine synthase (glutamine-hydrolysing)